MLIHQSQSHPGLVQGFLNVPTLDIKQQPQKSFPLPPYSASANRGFKCQETQCAVQVGNPEEMANHLFLDHYNKAKLAFTDYQCAHCLGLFESISRLVIHVKLVHKKKIRPNLIIRHIDQAMTIDDSEGKNIYFFKCLEYVCCV